MAAATAKRRAQLPTEVPGETAHTPPSTTSRGRWSAGRTVTAVMGRSKHAPGPPEPGVRGRSGFHPIAATAVATTIESCPDAPLRPTLPPKPPVVPARRRRTRRSTPHPEHRRLPSAASAARAESGVFAWLRGSTSRVVPAGWAASARASPSASASTRSSYAASWSCSPWSVRRSRCSTRWPGSCCPTRRHHPCAGAPPRPRHAGPPRHRRGLPAVVPSPHPGPLVRRRPLLGRPGWGGVVVRVVWTGAVCRGDRRRGVARASCLRRGADDAGDDRRSPRDGAGFPPARGASRSRAVVAACAHRRRPGRAAAPPTDASAEELAAWRPSRTSGSGSGPRGSPSRGEASAIGGGSRRGSARAAFEVAENATASAP